MQLNIAVIDPRPTNSLLALDEATDPARCGHKAASLADLRRRGFDVPDGFVIPAFASPSRAEIAAALARLGDGPVAVRSSGVAEDLPDASFAGQYDTLLGVRGPEAVLEAVQRCVASASHERLAAYGRGVGPMAVLVQRMVDASASGVAFSANPLTGDRSEVRVSVTRGLGERLVAGEVDADEWSVRNGDAAAIAEPQRAIGPELVRRVAELARRCEAARGTPQDIEWAVAGDRLSLLQSRPITALPVAPEIEIPKGTWQKDAAHFPEPVAPFAATTHLVLLTDQLPTGLVRRVALEAGRRLTTSGRLERHDDAVMLTANELRDAVLERSDVKGLVSRRKAEHAWVRANPGPMTYGPEPGKTPDVRGLPAPARRINGAALWMLEHEISPPPKASAGAVRGIAASPGVYRGRARVIRSASELSSLRPGEVLVCPTTTAAWTIVFQRAGALITDAGSVLSHTAIVAREFGLPAVVATSNATSTLKDGEEVIVDGNRGEVERVAGARRSP